MPKTLIKNARIVNESSIFESDILVEDQFIEKIASSISDDTAEVIRFTRTATFTRMY
jgi:dihydroorotase